MTYLAFLLVPLYAVYAVFLLNSIGVLIIEIEYESGRNFRYWLWTFIMFSALFAPVIALAYLF